jgi:predicted  nucleic acid-binding Zn-ribbon protein
VPKIPAMSDAPDSLILVYLRRIDQRMERLEHTLDDIRQRVTTLELQAANQAAIEQSHYASLSGRIDSLSTRMDRIERRLDIVPA